MLLLLACIGSSPSPSDDAPLDTDAQDSAPPGPPRVEVVTSMGDFVIELDDEAAPVTVENFLVYVDEGFFDGDDGLGATTFHRVIDGFMIQGGGWTDEGRKDTHDPIENEATTDARNVAGSVAMARTSDPDSATSQFFVNLVDNPFLDPDGSYPPGYAVFGHVVEGFEVVQDIGAVATDSNDAPLETVTIEDLERL